MNSDCIFTVKIAYAKNVLRVFIWLFPFSACLFMVWATTFHEPEEWHITFMWFIGLVVSSLAIYHSLLYRATLKVSKEGVEYTVKGKMLSQFKWQDIAAFKAYKSNSLDGTTAGALVPKWGRPIEIGIVYSDQYKNGDRTKWEKLSMSDDGIHYSFLLGSDLKNKKELVDRLNFCNSKRKA